MFGWINRLFMPLRPAPPSRPFYVGHRGSMIYHRLDCMYGRNIRRKGRVLSDQRWAIKEGFSPCKTCQPDRHPYRPDEWVPNVWKRSY